jgi:hypothetical protein
MILLQKGYNYYDKKKKNDYMDRGAQIQKLLFSPDMSAVYHTPAYYIGRSNHINTVIKGGNIHDRPDTAAYRHLHPA